MYPFFIVINSSHDKHYLDEQFTLRTQDKYLLNRYANRMLHWLQNNIFPDATLTGARPACGFHTHGLQAEVPPYVRLPHTAAPLHLYWSYQECEAKLYQSYDSQLIPITNCQRKARKLIQSPPCKVHTPPL